MYFVCRFPQFSTIQYFIVYSVHESTAAMYVDKNELINMCNNGEIAYYLIDRIENEVSKYF